MRLRAILAGIGLMALSACATQPQYAVRPGEPRAEMPKPTYPIREGDQRSDEAGPSATSSSGASATPSSNTTPEGSSYYKPQPIDGAPPPPDESGRVPPPVLRGHVSPGPTPPVRSSPAPALETPSEVTVRPGESLFEVAERVRSPVRALIDLNGLKPPYEVTPGSTLRVPKPVVYTVQIGDTLFSIGRKFSVDPRSLANFNDISMDSGLKPGQRIALPASVTERGAAQPVEAETAASTEPLARSRKPLNSPTPTRAIPAPSEVEAPSPAAAAAAGKGKFSWPVKGDILSSFGPKGPGQRNDGINIAATAGDSVVAAAAGQVVYSGSTIPGFGNLVVIKHPDGWTSLYGNLGKIAVKIRAEVSKGQEIGVAGLSGPVDRPQVHFEVRYAATPQEKARPVDPQQVLP